MLDFTFARGRVVSFQLGLWDHFLAFWTLPFALITNFTVTFMTFQVFICDLGTAALKIPTPHSELILEQFCGISLQFSESWLCFKTLGARIRMEEGP